MERVNIVWLKRDLRFKDHGPLYQASRSDLKTIIIYIFEPLISGHDDFDIRHWQFTYRSLMEMKKKHEVNLFFESAYKVFNYLMKHYYIENYLLPSGDGGSKNI
jgi:deoxyribodipyrimidine photo-lyase